MSGIVSTIILSSIFTGATLIIGIVLGVITRLIIEIRKELK